jgi:caspase-like apoptosis-related cysteine protease
MNHKKRGMAIIFNHEYFDISLLKRRTGTNVDCANLKHTLNDLGFRVTVHNDLTAKEITNTVEQG